MPQAKKTLKEIAAEAGVSIGTVHRAIYGKPGLGEETRRRILDIVEAANYRINEVASMMKRSEMRVTVLLPSPTREDRFFFRGIWKGVRDAAASLSRYKVGFDCMETPYRLDKMANALRDLYDGEDSEGINGIVTIADTPEAEEWVSRFSRRGVAVVLVASYEREAKCVASVKTDHRTCGQLAAEFLSYALPDARGRVLFLPGQPDSHSNQIYAGAFADHMAAVAPSSTLIRIEGIGRTGMAGKITAALAKDKPDAIFCCNARNTNLVCELLAESPPRKRPLFIGSDVFTEIAPYFDRNILDASIYQFHREQGERAVTLLYEHLSGNSIAEAAMTLPALLALRSNYRYFSS
ncbi:MAG: LacI family transcriptional regulator [Planctomycetaceae bacterium]|nr:LacI family transcriptional regulator [Planctomycetaceae bacterium]